MIKSIEVCDICDMDGDETIAVGCYKAHDRKYYAVCKKHSEDAKAEGFTIKDLDE